MNNKNIFSGILVLVFCFTLTAVTMAQSSENPQSPTIAQKDNKNEHGQIIWKKMQPLDAVAANSGESTNVMVTTEEDHSKPKTKNAKKSDFVKTKTVAPAQSGNQPIHE